jgi:quercetin dioxygenase-like cupin family protein
MVKSEFIHLLIQEGYPEPVEVQQPPNGRLDEHTHPFEVKALVIEGSIDLIINGHSETFMPGDIFELDFEELHAESYGPKGVKYLVSRLHS